MAASTDQLIALGQDPNFRLRVRNLMLLESAVIYGESAGTANHAARALLAAKLAAQPSLADQFADYLATRTNLVASTVAYDFGKRAVVTDATDAAIRSQINSDWNQMAAV